MAIGGAYLNAQFCAAVLRLTDILDFDRERTPRILFESLGITIRSLPGAEVSLREWQKHMAVHSLEVNADEIVVSAETHHPVIEKAIRDFCVIIEREVRDTQTILRQNSVPVASQYVVDLPGNVRAQIRPVGYVYKDMSLSLNQSRIMALLMGERLYSEPAVALRELLQNSIDACSVRRHLENDRYAAQISVTADRDDDDRWWLEVSDNGCGMDEHVLAEYFLKLGNSYYSSPEFARVLRSPGEETSSFVPMSRFGIGMVSVFLIADVLEVCTRSAHSPRRDELQRHLRIERLGAVAFVTEHQSTELGTRMRLRLRPEYGQKFKEFQTQLANYLQRTIIRPPFLVTVQLPEAQFILASKSGFRLKPNARDLLSSRGLEAVLLDIERWSDRFSGTVGLIFSKTQWGELSHLLHGQYLRLGNTGVRPDSFLEGYGGNRLTVSGFSMSMRKAGRVLGKGKNRLAVVFDLEIRGDKDVEYDISRQRIVGPGRQTVMTALESAIRQGLRDTGITDRLEPVTRTLLDDAPSHERDLPDASWWYDSRPVTDFALLEKVKNLVPGGAWPKGMHRSIAEQLSISNKLSVRAISTLLQTGQISHISSSSATHAKHGVEPANGTD
jgi:molecular chaperone HtpG